LGNENGNAVEDECGVCGGDNTSCNSVVGDEVNSLWFEENDNGTYNIGYNSSTDFTGFQFKIVGSFSTINAIGGTAEEKGFSVSTNDDGMILGFSLISVIIEAGVGTLIVIELDGEPTDIIDIVVSDLNAEDIGFHFDNGD